MFEVVVKKPPTPEVFEPATPPLAVKEEQLALELSRLSAANIETEFAGWRKGGSNKKSRDSRKGRAARLKPRLPYLLVRATTGAHRFTMPTVGTVDGRTVARLTDEDAVLVGAIAEPFTRHSRLRQLLRDSFAYFGPGCVAAVQSLRTEVAEAAKRLGVVEVAGADFFRCFDNLSPERAIFHMRTAGFSGWRLDALEKLYAFWLQRSEFRGLVTGPSASAYLSEFALAPFDRLLARHARVLRYSDNFFATREAGAQPCWPELVEQVLAEFNAAEGLKLTAHKLQTVTYDAERGFHQPFLMLGCHLMGHEVRPAPAKVEQCARKLAEAGTAEQARARLEGWRQHYLGLVPEWDLNLITSRLWAQEQSQREGR